MKDAKIVYCPAGIKRSSPNDVKKRNPYDWNSKYNNLFLVSRDGIVFEGMNEHGFSASLMFLAKSVLMEPDRMHIPIAASQAVNFFIDHFKCIDTALLACWDIRIHDDIGMDCGWPFRIVLHDSTGSAAIIEYVQQSRQIYTPDPPALLVAGPEYSRLLTIRHLQDSVPKNEAEERYLDILNIWKTSDSEGSFRRSYSEFAHPGSYLLFRDHLNSELKVMGPEGIEVSYKLAEIEFSGGEETVKPIY